MKDIDDFLVQDCGGKFENKTWLFGLFGSMVYVPTREKVKGGFRYFACELPEVLEAFESGDVSRFLKLPFAVDEEGDVDTSSIVLDLHYTPSGSVVALQVREYQNHNPTPVTSVRLLEGAAGRAALKQVMELDQSN